MSRTISNQALRALRITATAPRLTAMAMDASGDLAPVGAATSRLQMTPGLPCGQLVRSIERPGARPPCGAGRRAASAAQEPRAMTETITRGGASKSAAEKGAANQSGAVINKDAYKEAKDFLP